MVVVADGIPVRASSRKLRRGEASEEYMLGLSLISLRITFGVKRDKITYRVGVPLGLCPVGLELVHHIAVREVEARGYKVPEEAWVVKEIEFLEDFRGFRLNGLEGVTFWNVLGEMEKIYNKPGIRHEFRTFSTTNIGFNLIRSLLREGTDASLTHRRIDSMERKLDKYTETQKGANRLMIDHFRKQENATQALLDAFIRDRGGSP